MMYSEPATTMLRYGIQQSAFAEGVLIVSSDPSPRKSVQDSRDLPTLEDVLTNVGLIHTGSPRMK